MSSNQVNGAIKKLAQERANKQRIDIGIYQDREGVIRFHPLNIKDVRIGDLTRFDSKLLAEVYPEPPPRRSS